MLRGTLQTAFAPGQRTAFAHVAFCPPFAMLPQLEFRQVDGPAARIKLGQLQTYGARFELKLIEASDDSATVGIEFTAQSGGA